LVDTNSPVIKGQVLALLDQAHLQAAADLAQARRHQAQTELARLQSKLTEAKLEYKRLQTLWKQNQARQEFDSAYNTYVQTLDNVQEAQGRLQKAEAAWQRNAGSFLHDYQIISPEDGLVLSVMPRSAKRHGRDREFSFIYSGRGFKEFGN